MTQADFLKARLDLLKILISALFGIMLLLVLYIVQNPSLPLIWGAKFGILVFGCVIVILAKFYDRAMNELKNCDEKGNIVIGKREAVMTSETTQDTGKERMRGMSFGEKLEIRLIERFNLDDVKKSKLIEVLLIVGSILAVLTPPRDLIRGIFMFFIFFSIYYYIFIQKINSKSVFVTNFFAFFTAVTFSLLVIANLFSALANILDTFWHNLLFVVYFIALTWILFAALMQRQDVPADKQDLA